MFLNRKMLYVLFFVFLCTWGHSYADQSPNLKNSQVQITNNAPGVEDVIRVNDLQKNDVIRVYATQDYVKNVLPSEPYDYNEGSGSSNAVNKWIDGKLAVYNGNSSVHGRGFVANVTPGKEYTFSAFFTPSEKGKWTYVAIGDTGTTFEYVNSYSNVNKRSWTFTPTQNQITIRFARGGGTSDTITFGSQYGNMTQLTDPIYVSQMQLELGSVATPFEQRASTGELLNQKTSVLSKNKFHSSYFLNKTTNIKNENDNDFEFTDSGVYEITTDIAQKPYTLSSYYTAYADDTSTNPRMSVKFWYTDGTTKTCSPTIAPQDGVERFASVTCTPDAGKTIAKITGWIADYSTKNIVHRRARNVQLEEGSVVTSYETPTFLSNLTIPQLGSNAGNVRISLTRANMTTSDAVNQSFQAEPKTKMLVKNQIKINNRVDAADDITISGLTSGDVVKVYQKTKNVIGSAGNFESIDGVSTWSITPSFDNENRTNGLYGMKMVNTSATPQYGFASIWYNFDSSKYYVAIADFKNGNVEQGQRLRFHNGTTNTVSGSLNKSTTFTTKYIKIKPDDMLSIGKNQLMIDNINSSTASVGGYGYVDSLRVYEISKSIYDLIDVDPLYTGTNLIKKYPMDGFVAQGVADGTGKVTISISEIGSKSGSLAITNTSGYSKESEKLFISAASEDVSKSLTTAQVFIKNNLGATDEVQVKKIPIGATVTVYDASKVKISSAVSTSSTLTLSMNTKDLSTLSKIHVSIKETEKNESNLVSIKIPIESTSLKVSSTNVKMTNLKNQSDTIQFTQLKSGDQVYVYRNRFDASTLASGSSSAGLLSLSLDLGDDKGIIYVSRKSGNYNESARTPISYSAAK